MKEQEGGLKAPKRNKIDWEDPKFYDMEDLQKELERVFDICHGCRRCFNLCNAFPLMFDRIDEGKTGEIDGLVQKDYEDVASNCTLCDMCYMVKCPYVPPHEFNVDFPHLMLRYKAILQREGKMPKVPLELANIDRNYKALSPLSKFLNWINKEDNKITRPLMEKTLGIHQKARIPQIASKTLIQSMPQDAVIKDKSKRKVAVYVTCFMNYNDTKTGKTLIKLLEHFGAEVKVFYPGCCGMPLFEQGQVEKVAEKALNVATFFSPLIDEGFDVVSLVPSCSLMIKSEWPLLLPNEKLVLKLQQHSFDISEYLVKMIKELGAPSGLKPLKNENVILHVACHVKAQNIGIKVVDLLKMIPNLEVSLIDRCAGHGGSWGMMVDHFDVAMKVGKPVFDKALALPGVVASECPLAKEHIDQGIEGKKRVVHPLELLAESYSL